ncbi:MAG: hypothetical protein NTW14_00905 [bacterium]|nr:hypothetical protein [bacterium]
MDREMAKWRFQLVIFIVILGVGIIIGTMGILGEFGIIPQYFGVSGSDPNEPYEYRSVGGE